MPDKSEVHKSPQKFVFSIWNFILITLLARLIWTRLLNFYKLYGLHGLTDSQCTTLTITSLCKNQLLIKICLIFSKIFSDAVNKYREYTAVSATLPVLRQQPHSANSVYQQPQDATLQTSKHGRMLIKAYSLSRADTDFNRLMAKILPILQ